MGYSPKGHKESGMTEQLNIQFAVMRKHRSLVPKCAFTGNKKYPPDSFFFFFSVIKELKILTNNNLESKTILERN